MSDPILLTAPFKGKDLTGTVFGRLTVVSYVGMHHGRNNNPKGRYYVWRCRCSCGNTTDVLVSNLKKGLVISCGCAGTEARRALCFKHGLSNRGENPHPLYRRWMGMHARCNDKSNKYYGGRGISVCERWHDFKLFLEDMEATFREGLTLERVNNDGNYEPGNVVWATPAEQARNTRRTT